MDRYAQFAFVAAREALEDAKFPDDPEIRDRTGAIVASGIGGIITIQDTVTKARAAGSVASIEPVLHPDADGERRAGADLDGLQVARAAVRGLERLREFERRASRSPTSTSRAGTSVAMVTGGAEATISDIAMGGFDSMKALSTRNDEPTEASRPFDRERDGFVLGEGGAILVLEELEFAKRRGARIYAEMLGYGQSADAYNLVAVDPTGSGVELALQRALAERGHRGRKTSTTSTRTAPRRRSAIRPSRRRSRRSSASRSPPRGQLDEEHARPRARRRGRDRRRGDGPRRAQRHHPADDQLRVSRSRSARSTTSPTSRAARPSTSRCPTPSASAATTACSSSGSIATRTGAGSKRCCAPRGAPPPRSGAGRSGVRARERRARRPSRAPARPVRSNERLEFFGDAVLGFIVARMLYDQYPDAPEGELALRKSALVSDAVAGRHRRAARLRAAAEARRRLRRRPVRAGPLDAGRRVRSVRRRARARAPASRRRPRSSSANTSRPSTRARSRPQIRRPCSRNGPRRTAARRRATPSAPRDRRTSAVFTATVFVDGAPAGEGAGPSKKEAQRAAAARALEHPRRARRGRRSAENCPRV